MEGTQRAVGWMSGDHDSCFSTLVLKAFRQVFFNANALPCITIGADVWGESGIMTGVINAGARLLCTSAWGLSWVYV